jgi:hypothetical protein
VLNHFTVIGVALVLEGNQSNICLIIGGIRKMVPSLSGITTRIDFVRFTFVFRVPIRWINLLRLSLRSRTNAVCAFEKEWTPEIREYQAFNDGGVLMSALYSWMRLWWNGP